MIYEHNFGIPTIVLGKDTNYERPMRKSPSLHGRKSTPTPKFCRYHRSIFCLPKFSDFFDWCLHWVSVICAQRYGYSTNAIIFFNCVHFWPKIIYIASFLSLIWKLDNPNCHNLERIRDYKIEVHLSCCAKVLQTFAEFRDYAHRTGTNY